MNRRYYCPACGQVAGTHATRHIARVKGKRVEPHALTSALTSALSRDSVAHSKERCPGGVIDKTNDRAP